MDFFKVLVGLAAFGGLAWWVWSNRNSGKSGQSGGDAPKGPRRPL